MRTFSLNWFCATIAILCTVTSFYSCKAQSPKNTIQFGDTSTIAPESRNFTAHIIKLNDDGSKAEIDTITGYRKYYYKNGKMQMEGKITKAIQKDYRDGIWKYYNEAGQLMNQEVYIKEGKINQLELMYFTNGKPLSETYQYYEGDHKNKSTFKFHKVVKLFYSNGQELSERHWINNDIVDTKCWDPKGNPKSIEYLNAIKSVDVNQ